MQDKNPWGFIEKNLYALKRQYGTSVVVYKLSDVDTNYRTGQKTVVRSLHQVRRVIMLPEDILRKVGRTNNKTGESSAGIEEGDATFIFDPRDLPNDFQFELDDYVVVKDGFFKLVQIEEYGVALAWVLKTRRVNGSELNVTIEASASDSLALSGLVSEVQ